MYEQQVTKGLLLEISLGIKISVKYDVLMLSGTNKMSILKKLHSGTRNVRYVSSACVEVMLSSIPLDDLLNK